MISGVSSVAWMDENIEGDNSTAPPPSSWANMNTIIIDTSQNQSHSGFLHTKDDMDSLCAFKPMLEIDDDWYMPNSNNGIIQNQQDIIRDISFSPNHFVDHDNLLLNPVDSSTSCSPSSTAVFNTPQIPYFLPQKPTLPPLLNDNPLDHGFEMGCDVGFLEPQGFTDFSSNNEQISLPNLCPDPQLPNSGIIQQVTEGGFSGFRGFEEGHGKPMFVTRPKMLRPLESLPPSGEQPTLFQKRVAFRKKLETKNDCEDRRRREEENEKKRKMGGSWEEVEDISIDGSALNYDSDDFTENTMRMEESGKNDGGGDKKGKKKGMPAKNLMAERRRRKKLNDRLYMLRSVVPKISKVRFF